jgi:hypothetical protein
MGSSVQAICPCGVEEEIMIGGGMLDYETYCSFPCCCEKCHSLVEANLLVKQLRCPKCRSTKMIPYGDHRLVGEKGENVVESWDDLSLSDGTYKCPECEKMTLRFRPGEILWD